MLDTDALRQKANRQLYTWYDLVTALDEIERLRKLCGEGLPRAGIDTRPIVDMGITMANYQLDVHHNICKNKVSVWHPETLDRVTTCYDDHGGPLGAMEFAVSLCMQHIAKGSS